MLQRLYLSCVDVKLRPWLFGFKKPQFCTEKHGRNAEMLSFGCRLNVALVTGKSKVVEHHDDSACSVSRSKVAELIPFFLTQPICLPS